MRHRDNVVVLAQGREATELCVTLEPPRKSLIVGGLNHRREIRIASGPLVDQLVEEITIRHCDKGIASTPVYRGLASISPCLCGQRPRPSPTLRSGSLTEESIDSAAEALEARRTDDEAAAIAAERIRSGAADHEEDGAEALRKLGIELP